MIFQDKSEKEIQLASRQLHRRQQLHAKGSVMSVKKLAEFLQSIESDESLLLQRMRDREANLAQQGFHQVSASAATLKPVDDERSEDSADDVGEDCAVPSKFYGEFEWGSLQDFLVAFLKDRGVSALAIFKPIPWPTLYWSKPRRS